MFWKKCMTWAITLLIVAICICLIAPLTSNVNRGLNKKYIEEIDNNIANVMKLEAGAMGASAIISFLPDDECTPIAEELAELAKYFLIVLCALYLEKYLVGLMGYICFGAIIPIACIAFVAGKMKESEIVKSFSLRLGLCGLIFYLLIPVSMWCSTTINNNYENSIEDTIERSDSLRVQQLINQNNEDEDGIKGIVSWIRDTVGTTVDYAADLLSDFVESLAVMIVTACLIPILVFILFSWMLKSLIDVDLTRAFVTRVKP